MIKISNVFNFLLVLAMLVSVSACVDTDFDEPESGLIISDDDVMDIADVLALIPNSGLQKIDLTDDLLGTEPKYIKATVTADDASGNLFKTIYFQDATGALTIIPDQNELNAEFPEGATIYVKLNGLVLGRDSDVPKLAWAVESNRYQRIPEAFVSQFLFAGSKTGTPIEAEVITLADFSSNPSAYFNKLVTITGVEVSNDFVGATYAISDGPDGPESVNVIVKDCDDRELILRNSGFASFTTQVMPIGNGSMTGIPSKFASDLQFFIRYPEDLDFEGDRCDGSTGEFPENELSLATIKNDFLSLGVDKIPSGFISGVVISDEAQSNITNRNLVFQSGGTGIVLRFGAAHNYSLGQKLKVNVSGQSFSEFNGLNQIDGLNGALVQQEGNETLPEPVVVSVDDMLSDIYSYESIRVKIEGATIQGGSYAGNLTFTDATGSIKSFIQGFASFNGQPTPSGTVDVIGYGSLFTDPQISINGPSDVTGGSVVNPPGGDGDVSQTFEGKTDFESVDLEGWLNITTIGNTPWYFRTFDDNGFVECEAFQADDAQTETWLITPVIDTDDKSIFSFETSQAFWKHQGLSVWISPEFTNLDDAEWVEISEANIASISDPQYEFVSSGEIDLKSIESGKVRVGWKYEGTSGANTTKMRIDNVVLK